MQSNNYSCTISIILDVYDHAHSFDNVWFICGSTFINMLVLSGISTTYTTSVYVIYYESIELMQRRTQRYKLQNYFCVFIGVSNALFVTMTSYYIFRYHPVFEKSYIEIIGIFGGIGLYISKHKLILESSSCMYSNTKLFTIWIQCLSRCSVLGRCRCRSACNT